VWLTGITDWPLAAVVAHAKGTCLTRAPLPQLVGQVAVLVAILPRRWRLPLAVGHPALTFLTVIVTGNHFIVDSIAGSTLTLTCVAGLDRAHSRVVGAVGRSSDGGSWPHCGRQPGPVVLSDDGAI
jgi:hypothetical protein